MLAYSCSKTNMFTNVMKTNNGKHYLTARISIFLKECLFKKIFPLDLILYDFGCRTISLLSCTSNPELEYKYSKLTLKQL